ncbi:hypothetical protein CPB84DRAFT_1792102 [Gymnopilus junonius]|uniref:Transmembrane protein n=1 Tax=Gymnopilus junonius TaxID=109634 RepID=A0A9P5NFP4_GYMJU|nr:hypothetical protein CPB84DRAFT_1792102 [Gymnopilus junonius]
MSASHPSSSTSSASPEVRENTEEDSRTRVPKWIPISAFIGTSLAIAIPLLMVRRQRTGVTRMSLKPGTSAPPPRRSSGPVGPVSSTSSASSTSQPISLHQSIKEALTEESASLMSALSRMNKASAILAAKAFAIATGLVAVSGFGLVWTVKTTLGIQDAHEFGQRMRSVLWSSAPGLASRIHRPPETDEERRAALQVAPFGIHEEWNWPEAEKRLQKAYDEGGVPLWSQAVLRELEAEARVERAKREKEIAAQKRKEEF